MTDAKENNIKNILGADAASQEVAEKAVAEAKKNLDEEMRLRRIKLIKIGVILMLVSIVMIFMTIAWFTMNRDVGTSGMGVKVGYNGFELRVADGTIAYDDLYSFLDPDLSANPNRITDNTANGQTVRWRITGNSDPLRPGSQGVLEFDIITDGTDVNSIVYDLALQCFTATITGTGDTETVTGLSEITSSSSHTSDEKAGANHLRGHLMFFKNRTGTTEADYQYSGFISDPSSFTLAPTLITGKTNEYTAKIYWIWPNTVGQIMLDSSVVSDSNYLGSGAVSVLNSAGETADRSAVTTYLKTNSATVFNGTPSTTYSDQIDSLYTKRTNSQSFSTEYDALSLGYNAADLLIGKNIDYVSVILTAVPG